MVLLIASLLLARTQARWTGPVVRLRPSPSGISASLTVSGKDVAPMWIGGCTGIPCAGSGSSETRWANWNFTVTQAARVGLPLVEVGLPPYLWQQVVIIIIIIIGFIFLIMNGNLHLINRYRSPPRSTR